MAEPATLHRALFRGGVTQAQDVSDYFVNSGLTAVDSQRARRAILAESIPSIENGLWRLLPDGRIELIWKIKPGAAWHDGTPFTANDLTFTLTVAHDKEFPEFRTATFDALEYRTTHPSFEVMRHPQGPSNIEKLHSNQAPMPSNRFVGLNRAGYQNPEFDALIDSHMATIPLETRMQVLGQIVHHMTDQLNVMGLFYDLRPTRVGSQVQNMAANNPTLNVHEWDLAR